MVGQTPRRAGADKAGPAAKKTDALGMVVVVCSVATNGGHDELTLQLLVWPGAGRL